MLCRVQKVSVTPVTVNPQFLKIIRAEIRRIDRELAHSASPAVLQSYSFFGRFLSTVFELNYGLYRRVPICRLHAYATNTHCDLGASTACALCEAWHDDDAWWHHRSSSHGRCTAPRACDVHVDCPCEVKFLMKV